MAQIDKDDPDHSANQTYKHVNRPWKEMMDAVLETLQIAIPDIAQMPHNLASPVWSKPSSSETIPIQGSEFWY